MPNLSLFFAIVTGLILIVSASIIFWTIKNGISPMPTSLKAKKCLLEALPKLSGIVYELGSGWGTLAFPIASRHPDVLVIGYETSPFPYFYSKILSLLKRLPNLKLIRKDFFKISLTDASVVVCYLYPGAMQKLKVKFSEELKPGTLIISNTFAIPGWRPEKVIVVKDLYRSRIYIYKISDKMKEAI